MNAKRVQRIWRREGLKVPQKQPKTGQAVAQRRILPVCGRAGPITSAYDFVMDRTHDGRKFRMLTVIEVYR